MITCKFQDIDRKKRSDRHFQKNSIDLPAEEKTILSTRPIRYLDGTNPTPPDDKPKMNELKNCSIFFKDEISQLKNLKVIITLGKVAFDNCIKFYKKNYLIDKKIIFKHGKKYMLPDGKILIPCYHPSPRNVNTKVINLKMMKNLFIKAKYLF